MDKNGMYNGLFEGQFGISGGVKLKGKSASVTDLQKELAAASQLASAPAVAPVATASTPVVEAPKLAEHAPPAAAEAPVAPEVVASQEAPAAAPATSETASAPKAFADEDALAQRLESLPALPQVETVAETFEEQRIGRMEPAKTGDVHNGVSNFENKEAFEDEMRAHLAVQNGPVAPSEAERFPWIEKPTPWPVFIEFPSRRDMAAIEAAERSGQIDDEFIKNFNAMMKQYAERMQDRAVQVDAWISDYNKSIDNERKTTLYGLIFKNYARDNLNHVNGLRQQYQDEAALALKEGREPKFSKDIFMDIKWSVLLDPNATPDDPRFSNVARWGHGVAIMKDGGKLRADDNGMYVPYGDHGSEMAGSQAVLEAFERGWTHININGSEEFIKGAREQAIRLGMGAKITTTYGLLGKSNSEYIMPRPPALPTPEADKNSLDAMHRALMGDAGKAEKTKRPEGQNFEKRVPKKDPEDELLDSDKDLSDENDDDDPSPMMH